MPLLLPRPLAHLLFASAGVVITLAADLPSPANYHENWPRFRGPDGGGFSLEKDLPVTCDVAAGKNVAWSVEVPAEGFSSPVIWGDRVFLSGGDESKCEVMAFDATTGKVEWEKTVPRPADAADEKFEVPDQCGMAAATVATDGLRVYAIFANGDLAAFDFAGALVWSKRMALPKNPYGHAASLLTVGDLLIVQFDQGDPDDHLSKLYALDGATGKVVWEQPRPVGASWATPLIFDAGGLPQIATLAVPWVIAYAVKDGAELWRAECLDGEVTPSPIFAAGQLLVVSPASKLQSIRPDGRGEVTKSHLGWMAEDGIPDISSPVSDGTLVFVVNTGGTITCYDTKDGRKQWEHDLGEEIHASPSVAGGRVYLLTRKGTLITVAAAREFQELGRGTLGEPIVASPAIAHGHMVIRGTKHLISLVTKPQN